MTYYERAIALQPDYAQAHFNLGMTLLQLGDYRRGFAEYEWRWQTGQFTPFQCPHPKWDGRPIPDKTLLIHTEQGAGDAIQFARFLPLAAQRCQKLMLVCRADFIPVFATMPGIAEIREAGQIKVSEFDTYVPLLSLPHVLGMTLETIPAEVPYFDVAAIRRRKDLRYSAAACVLCPAQGGDRVGGSPTYRNDRHRSCALREFCRCCARRGSTFYSVQKGERSQELAQLPPEVQVQDLAPSLHDFGDLAVILDQFDLVITVDTSVAHMAGALGKPVWVLLHRCAGLALGVRGGDHAVVSDDAAVSPGPGRGLGGGDGTGGAGADGVAGAVKIFGVRQPCWRFVCPPPCCGEDWRSTASPFAVAQAYGWQLEAWAIFANHYHFIAYAPPEVTSLRRMLQRLHAATARAINRLDHPPAGTSGSSSRIPS